MISNIDEPDKALSLQSNILFIQSAADAALVKADIVGAIRHYSVELGIAVEHAVAHRTTYPLTLTVTPHSSQDLTCERMLQRILVGQDQDASSGIEKDSLEIVGLTSSLSIQINHNSD